MIPVLTEQVRTRELGRMSHEEARYAVARLHGLVPNDVVYTGFGKVMEHNGKQLAWYRRRQYGVRWVVVLP